MNHPRPDRRFYRIKIAPPLFLRRLNNGDSRDRIQDDLVRKIANHCFDWTKPHDPYPHVKSKCDEFRRYFEEFGIAQTELGIPSRSSDYRVLATSPNGKVAYAAEVESRRFFLPLKPLSKPGELPEILRCAVDSIIAYKKRNDLYLPAWLDEIRFKTERNLRAEIQALEEQIERSRIALGHWPRYKAVLTASGRLLNEVIVTVLREFFHLNLQSEETYIEDAMIYGETDERLFVVEIKGVNAGIKREHINQLDSHRERLGLNHGIPGLLIINDFAEVVGIEARKAKPIDAQHLEHANRLNVRLLRTTTLIELMLATEDRPDRAKLFLCACNQASPLVCLPSLTTETCE